MVLYHFGTSATSVLADGNYVYTDQGIVDMTNIKSPFYVSKSQDFAGSGVTKFGNNYLVVASSDGLHIIDVSNKQSPVTVTTFEPGVSDADVKIHGNVAVAAVGNSIVAIDLSEGPGHQNVSASSILSRETGTQGLSQSMTPSCMQQDTGSMMSGHLISRILYTSDSLAQSTSGVISCMISYDNGYLAVGGKMATYILSTSLDGPVPTPTDPCTYSYSYSYPYPDPQLQTR